MSHKLINLLPEDRIKAWRRDYFIRLGTVGIFLLILLTVIHGTLLFPSYLSLSGKREAKANELAHLQQNLAGSKQSELQARLVSLKGDATYLSKLGTTPSASASVRAILAIPHGGIKLTGFTFNAPSATDSSGQMTVTGVATTREALRAYNLALSGLPFVTAVDLPISAYAQESDIAFTMKLSGTPTP
jgi:hypothetical protein